RPALQAFDNAAIAAWAEGLGQDLFTGTTGRVFPKVMKASPLLRAWLGRLADLGVETHLRQRWTGWDAGRPVINDAAVTADATILACGGASWARLGADGAWADWIGIATTPFAPSNAALAVDWSDHMSRHLGTPLKGVAWRAGPYRSRGEAVLSAKGLEGGGIYTVSRGVREGARLTLDLLPDLSVDDVAARLSKPRGKASLANHLRKTLRLDPLKTALAQEWGRPLPAAPLQLARRLKKLTVTHAGVRPMDEAISTAGGVPFAALDDHLMVRARPGVFCAGEMLDWEAPTGGYLLTACFATGRWAGQGALDYLAAAAL
ncbi:MAG: TIGR03862 family flavoprotein, partial [Pseudomonadota bacterium]